MANGIRTDDPRGFNKGRSSKFHEGSRVWQTPEEGQRTYRPKRWGNNNKDEDDSPKTLNDKNHKKRFRRLHKILILETFLFGQILYIYIYVCVCVCLFSYDYDWNLTLKAFLICEIFTIPVCAEQYHDIF